MPATKLYKLGRRKVTLEETLARRLFAVAEKPITEILDKLVERYLKDQRL